MNLIPLALRGYRREWLLPDVIAGITLAAIAIPEVLGYTSISQTPLVTGLYTIILPTAVFALVGASRLLVIGADSATAAILAAGLTSIGITGATPGSEKWVALTSLVALVCAGMLVVARVLRLGFIGDFLSASVLVGFLSGVGVQVLSGQIPEMLGVPKDSGNWLAQQVSWMTDLGNASTATVVYAGLTVLTIVAAKRWAPRVPGALVAVVVLTAASAILDSAASGVAVVGRLDGGPPPLGLPSGLSLSDVTAVLPVAFSCFVIIVAQSAATARSFAMKRGDKADVNRDILGLAGSNLAAGLSGTFVVNGSPTKTEIVDEQRGRSQVANLTMSAVALVFTLFFTGLLQSMPKAVLAGIVFMIGLELVDVRGLRRIGRLRRSEFIIAAVTAVTVCVVGVQQGIALAIIASVVDMIRRQYRPKDFVVGIGQDGERAFQPVRPGTQSAPGLIVFRYDADLFFANAGRFVDDVEALVESAPDPVEWLIVDAGPISDIDYSALLAIGGLFDYLDARRIRLVLARDDEALDEVLSRYALDTRIPAENRFTSLEDAYQAFLTRTAHQEPASD